MRPKSFQKMSKIKFVTRGIKKQHIINVNVLLTNVTCFTLFIKWSWHKFNYCIYKES